MTVHSLAPRIARPGVPQRATMIVSGYDAVATLRQAFYRLASEQLNPNTPSAHAWLSSRPAAARRPHDFPGLIDNGRDIRRHRCLRLRLERMRGAANSLAREERK